jgi:replicative DNA helicase
MSDQKIDIAFLEKVIIYHVMTDEGYLASIIDHLKPNYFQNKRIRSFYEIISHIYEKRQAAPSMSDVKMYLDTPEKKENFTTVVKYFNEIPVKNFNKDELYDNTEQFLKEHAVYNTMIEVSDSCQQGEIDTSLILSKFETACNINLVTDKGLDYFNDIEKHITDLTTEDDVIPSTWPWLDEKLGGGFLENGRAIYVFAGETNVGKSIFLGNIACNIAGQNKTVLLITLEMSELVYAKRISSKITNIPIGKLAERADDIRQKIEYYKGVSAHKHSRILIKEFPPNTITCNHMKQYIKKVVDSGVKIDAVVVDYVNLLRASTGNNSYERIKDSTEQLRALSYVFNCPVITATQLNRSGFNEANPDMSTISESIGLAATADAILSLWQEEEDRELGIIKMGMMKNRFGPNFGNVAMRINYSTLVLAEDEVIDAGNDLNTTASSLNFLSDNNEGSLDNLDDLFSA